MEEFQELPVESFQHLCRSCLTYNHYLYPISEIRMEEGNLENILLFILWDKLDENMGLPQKMCKNCVAKIYDMYRFLKKFQDVQDFLSEKLFFPNQQVKEVETLNVHNKVTTINENMVDDESGSGEEDNGEQDATWTCDNITDESNCTEDERISRKIETGTDQNEKTAIGNMVDKIQQLKCEITSIRASAPPRKVTRRRVPADVSSRVSTIKRIRIPGPPFVCTECSQSFNIYMSLRKHWQMHNHHPKNFKCTYCGATFRSNCVLQQHIRTHTGEKPNVCNVCNKRFNHRSNFRRHMYTHSDKKRYKCTDCEQGFNRLEFLKDHQRKYHTGEVLLCPYCGKDFTCQGTLKIHERQHVNHKTEVSIDLNNPYQCRTCGKILASEEILNEHVKSHVKKKSLKKQKGEGDEKCKERRDPVCEHCQSMFKNSYELRLHRLHSSCSQFVQRYTCTQCDKFFITYGALYAHLKLHREENENHIYECDVCHEQFYKERRYKDHVKRHTRERKFVCSECGQRFFVRLHLDNHMRTHTGERPFVCDICHKAFALKVNLTVHMRIHNNIKPYNCSVCNHEFRDFSSLRKHSKRSHLSADVDVK